MKVYIYGTSVDADKLKAQVWLVIEELWLTDFVSLEQSSDDGLKQELNIVEEYALIIEEESIDFKDMIFEGIIPSEEELKSMFVSIIGWGSWWGCAPEGCWSGCSC